MQLDSICLNPNEASQAATVSFTTTEVKLRSLPNCWEDIKRIVFLFTIARDGE